MKPLKKERISEDELFPVSDNGIGLEKEYSAIFEVFKQLHAIGKYQGTELA